MNQREVSGSTVVVGMSGGVDSSVSALLLKQQGYRVIGLFMKNWDEEDEDGQCTAEQDYNDVAAVCEQIGIPFYSVNFVKEYEELVFQDLLDGLKKGVTPNPDILCNREIKFKHFYQKAVELGADYLATGHYCRVGTHNGKSALLAGVDENKDQSYFLHAINHKVLDHVLFPIGDLPKPEVRRLAREHGLAVSEKKDSTGICFVGKRDFRSFVTQYLPTKPGPFCTLDGKVVGEHCGAGFYTIGQRKGLGIGGPGDAWFVADKDMASNRVFVVQGGEHPALFKQSLTAQDLTWIDGEGPQNLPLRCMARVRYRQEAQPCTIESTANGIAHVRFDEPQRAVTPGQSVVFYIDDRCLGGGIIATTA